MSRIPWCYSRLYSFLLSSCDLYRITCYCDDRHTSVRFDEHSTDIITYDNINDQWSCACILCGDVCFSEVFRMRAVLFRTAGQGMRIHWSVCYWVIDQWLKNLLWEICNYWFCYSNLSRVKQRNLSFFSRINVLLVGTLISIGDFSVSIAGDTHTPAHWPHHSLGGWITEMMFVNSVVSHKCS